MLLDLVVVQGFDTNFSISWAHIKNIFLDIFFCPLVLVRYFFEVEVFARYFGGILPAPEKKSSVHAIKAIPYRPCVTVGAKLTFT